MSWNVRNQSDAAKRRAYDTRMSGAARTTDGVAAVAHIDESDLAALYERYPELDASQNTDKVSHRRAWERWLKGSASEPYRLRTKL